MPDAMPMTQAEHPRAGLSAPQMPQKAPISIMPSRPMLMTPLRSETTPPSAANSSGVANRSIAANSADHTTTRSRLLTPDLVAPMPTMTPMIAVAIAPQPSLRSPLRIAHTPQTTAATPRITVGTAERIVSGGIATNSARKPSRTPSQPGLAAVHHRRPPARRSAARARFHDLGAHAGTAASSAAAGLRLSLRRSCHR